MQLMRTLLRAWRTSLLGQVQRGRDAIDPVMDVLLSSPSVRMREPSLVAEKVKALVAGGLGHMQVISDFDYTISKFHDANGNRCLTTHMIFHEGAAQADEVLVRKLKALNDYYLPIEFDSRLSAAEKIPHMEYWWNTSHGLIADAKFSKTTLRTFVRNANVQLRENSVPLFAMLADHGVPLILFSAGIGDMIEIFLEQRLGAVPPNLHLISNMMIFDRNDCVVGFSKPLIHTFNKNNSVVSAERTFFHEIRNRPNVLLLGDSLGDLHMDVGVENEGAVFKIGFLNLNVDALLPKYLDGYDVVLVQDQSMDVPLTLLRAVNGQ